MIRAIFFDFDGVLTTDSNGSTTTSRNLHEALPNVPLNDILRCYRAHHGDIMVGKATHADVWESFCKCVGTHIDINLLHDAFRRVPRNEQMFDLCQKLRTHNMLGIITDNGKERFDAVTASMKLADLFNPIILSGNIGSRKDDPLIFEHALKAVSCRADECIFIDNYERNLTVPAQMGFRTYWHNDAMNDISHLQKKLYEWGVTFDA